MRFIYLFLGSCYTAHKRIVNIIKVYIKRNNIQVEKRFRKNIDIIDVCERARTTVVVVVVVVVFISTVQHQLVSTAINVYNTDIMES